MAETPQRRAADRIEADVLLAIAEQASDNRHALRNEFTVAINRLSLEIHDVGVKVEAGNTENVRMQATLGEVKRDVIELKTLPPRVAALEAKSLATEEVAKLKRWLVGAFVGMAGVMVASVAFLAQHVH